MESTRRSIIQLSRANCIWGLEATINKFINLDKYKQNNKINSNNEQLIQKWKVHVAALSN